MRRVNPVTLEMEEVIDKTPEIKYVYVLSERGIWDYEITFDVKVFNDFDSALTEFKRAVETAQHDMGEWCCEEDIRSEQIIDRDSGYASYDTYEDGNSEKFSDTIMIQKKEVIQYGRVEAI